jgi:hypothetical protein
VFRQPEPFHFQSWQLLVVPTFSRRFDNVGSLPPIPLTESKPRVGTSIRQAGDFPADIFPASRRLSVCGSFPPGEPGIPTVRSFPGEPFKSLPVSLRASSPGGLSRFRCPKAPVSPDSGKVGSAWGFPAASRFFPAAPPEPPWSPSRRILTVSALAASRTSEPFPAGHSILTL